MNRIFRTFFCISVVSLLVGCTSVKQPDEVFVQPDFTEEDARKNEIKRISEMAGDFPVKALWRSYVMGDPEVLASQEENVFSLFQAALDSEKYFEAHRLYISLKACGSKKINSSASYEKNLFAKSMENVPGLKSDRSLLPETMGDCVNSTVTIWVDKGIKIQNGIGYADRVLGSGFFIDKRGYIVTNHHVINDMVDPKYEGYSRLYIKLAADQETRIPAKVVGYDDVHDLALLKCEIEPPFVLELGSSASLNIGDKVNCIGTPLGLHGTVTSGIVSASDRKLFTSGGVFQIDAAVNSGNSGGPCIDAQKKVQAIVFAGILQYQGLNFAIPVEYLRQDLPYLYNGGKRHLAWLGAYGHTDKTAFKNNGVAVQYLLPGGVLYRAGLKVDDVITFLNGYRVYTLEQLQDILRNFSAETILTCSYNRDGESRTCLVYLEERPENPGYEVYRSDLLNTSMVPILGMELTSSSTMFKKQFTISRIIKGSLADESGFSELDPVYISDVDFDQNNENVSVQMNTRKKKKGYLDITMRLNAPLDSPWYF